MVFKAAKVKQIRKSSLEDLGDSVVDLAKYTEDEFAQVASALQDILQLQISNVAPLKPRKGMIAYADGVNWNPGNGEGIYVFKSDNTWNTLKGVGDSFRVFLSTALTISSSTFTRVAFDSVDYDTGGWWDAVNFQFKPKRAGYWQIAWGVFGGQSTTITQLFTSSKKNGAFVTSGSEFAPSGTLAISTGTDLLAMNGTTDVLELSVFITAAVAVVGQVGSNNVVTLSGYWVKDL